MANDALEAGEESSDNGGIEEGALEAAACGGGCGCGVCVFVCVCVCVCDQEHL